MGGDLSGRGYIRGGEKMGGGLSGRGFVCTPDQK